MVLQISVLWMSLVSVTLRRVSQKRNVEVSFVGGPWDGRHEELTAKGVEAWLSGRFELRDGSYVTGCTDNELVWVGE